jgi:hypothetical protein
MAGRGLGQAHPGPGERDDADQRQDVDRGPPAADVAEQLAERGRHHGDQNESRHDQRHDTRHLPAFIEIAHNGDNDDAGRGSAKPLEEAGRQQPGERLRGACQRGADREKDQAGEEDREAARSVGNPAGDQLAEDQSDQVARHDPLAVVVPPDTEILSEVGQNRQHDVDRQRRQAGQERCERHEFHGRQGEACRARDGHGSGDRIRRLL